MITHPRLLHRRKTLLLVGATIALTAATVVGMPGVARAAPCDIYGTGGTPCGRRAQHDTARCSRRIAARSTRCGGRRTTPPGTSGC